MHGNEELVGEALKPYRTDPDIAPEEVGNLSRCKNFTLNMGRGSNIKYKPYVFTGRKAYVRKCFIFT